MKFCINTKTCEVHRYYCEHIKNSDVIELGDYPSSYQAIESAKKLGYQKPKGCSRCCPQVTLKSS